MACFMQMQFQLARARPRAGPRAAARLRGYGALHASRQTAAIRPDIRAPASITRLTAGMPA
jgi:hypothetical protein